MDQGNYFRLDKSSRIEEGIIYFRYLPFVRKEPKGTESDYPIYLQITGSAINFYIQRRQQDPYISDHSQCSAFYQHTELFSLPLMMNLRSRDNLQKTMNEVYSGDIKFNNSEYYLPMSGYNNKSYSCIQKLTGITKSDKEKPPSLKSNFELLGNGIKKRKYTPKLFGYIPKSIGFLLRICFLFSAWIRKKILKVSTEIFNPVICWFIREHPKPKNDDKGRNEDPGIYSLYYKTIFLDFLFDLEHSTVFKNSPHYEQMEESLREDSFFTALSAKAEYYYLRNRFSEWIDKGKLFNEDYCYASGNIVNDYINDLTSWLNHIRKEGAEDLFYKSKWFEEDIEEEYKSVIFARSTDKGFKLLRKVNAFNRRHYKCKSNECSHYFELKKRILKVKGASNKWFIHRYAWFSAVRCRCKSINNFLPRLVMATASAWIVLLTSEEAWKTMIDTNLYSDWWLLILVGIMIAFLSNEIKNIALNKKTVEYFKRAFMIFSFGFIISLTVGAFFSNFNSKKIVTRAGYLTDLYIEKLSSGEFRESKINDLVAIDSTVLCSFEYGFNDKETDEKVELILNRLKNKSESEDFYDYNLTLNGSYDTVQAKLNIEIPKTYELQKVEETILFQKLYVLVSPGPLGLDIPIKLEHEKIHIFPHVLLFRSFLALFIGLFLQLIFEDKPVTEPL